MYKIFSSGFEILPIIIKGNENNVIVDIKTELDNELYIVLLANAITLTPGTITVENKGQNLKVLWINPTTEDSEEAGKIIKANFESLLMKASKKIF
jgi:multicomponent Na+:H+ antiporter subunit E